MLDNDETIQVLLTRHDDGGMGNSAQRVSQDTVAYKIIRTKSCRPSRGCGASKTVSIADLPGFILGAVVWGGAGVIVGDSNDYRCHGIEKWGAQTRFHNCICHAGTVKISNLPSFLDAAMWPLSVRQVLS